MAKFFSRLFKRAKKRIKAGLKDFRTWRLYMAGREILAEQDYEHLHVAKVSAKAGISVGAFYERFRSKDAFLSFLIGERFAQAQLQAREALDPKRLYGASASQIVRALTHYTISTLHGPMGGVVKAAVKRGQIDKAQRRQLNDYRAAVTQQALVLLKTKVGQSQRADQQVRIAVQVMHAVAIDTLHNDGGILRRGRKRTADALSIMMLSYLNLPLGHLATARATADEDDLLDSPNEFEPAPVNAVETAKDKETAKRSKSGTPKLLAQQRPVINKPRLKAKLV